MLRQVFSLLGALPEAFADRLRPRPVADAEQLAWFVRTRAAHVAQTSLYGYVKTRMGTKFREYFEDEVFSASIRISATRLFVSCAGDLAVYGAALAADGGRLGAAEAGALARRCFARALAEGLGEVDRAALPAGAEDAFALRVRQTDWAAAATGEAAFAGSVGDLVRFAPIVDELKALDREIVRNSIRFRWREVREQLRRRMRADAVAAGWRGRDG